MYVKCINSDGKRQCFVVYAVGKCAIKRKGCDDDVSDVEYEGIAFALRLSHYIWSHSNYFNACTKPNGETYAENFDNKTTILLTRYYTLTKWICVVHVREREHCRCVDECSSLGHTLCLLCMKMSHPFTFALSLSVYCCNIHHNSAFG